MHLGPGSVRDVGKRTGLPSAADDHGAGPSSRTVRPDPGRARARSRAGGGQPRWRRLLPVLAAIILTFLAHDGMDGAHQTGGDTVWNAYLAHSLIDEGDLDLNEWSSVRDRFLHHTYETHEGTWVSTYPIGTGVVSAPFVFAMALVEDLRGGDLFAALQEPFPPVEIETTIASAWVAITAGLVLVLVRAVAGTPASILAVGAFAFGTPALSTASRALWMHGPAMTILTVCLLLVWWVERRASARGASGLGVTWPAVLLGPLAVVGWMIRPTTAVGVGVAWAFLAWRHWVPSLLAILAAIPPAAAYLAVSRDLYVGWQAPYYDTGRVEASSTLLEALAGNLVSPGRGLLVWSPMLLLALAAVGRMHRSAPVAEAAVLRCAAVTVLAHLLLVSALIPIPDPSASGPDPWWAGVSVGPRLMTDVVPHLVLLAAVGLVVVLERTRGHRRAVAVVGLALLLGGVSVFANSRAALDDAPLRWHFEPVAIEDDPSRLWDYSDIPYLR